MSKTIRLTAAQALVRFMTAQMTVVDGQEVPIFAGMWAIFGHGNVAGMGEALWHVRDELPTYRGQNEQSMAHAAIAYANVPSATGALTPSLLSINADPTKFDLQAGQGYIIDNWTNPTAPTAVLVTWGAFTAQTATYRTTDTATTVMIDSTGAIVQKNTSPSHADYRDYIVIGKLIHTTKANILGTAPFVRAIPSSDLMAYDLANFLGVLARGVDITANGANLNLNRSAGTLFRVGSNAAAGLKDPNESDLGAVSAISFQYRYRNG